MAMVGCGRYWIFMHVKSVHLNILPKLFSGPHINEVHTILLRRVPDKETLFRNYAQINAKDGMYFFVVQLAFIYSSRKTQLECFPTITDN